MSKVDEELSRRFHRAERPEVAGGDFAGVAARPLPRRIGHRVQAGALAIVVVAGTVGGFVALREAFGEGEEKDVGTAPLPANGQIVFSKEDEDDRLEIFASQPDGTGLRQLTETE